MGLEQEIKISKSSEEIRNKTNELISQSNEIMQKIKDKHGISSLEYRKAWKEYEDIKSSIIGALKNDKEISKRELLLIQLEFSQLSNVSNEGNRSNLDKLSTSAKNFGASTDLLAIIGVDVTGLNAYQEELVENIIGNKNGYGNGYLHGFNKEKGGNYVLKIEDFEKDLKSKSVKDINSRALGNYFLYLKSEGKLNTNHLINIFGENTLFDLNELWTKTQDKDSLIARKHLLKNGGEEVLNIISMFSSTDDFLKKANKLDEKQAKIALELLDKNLNSIKEKFKQDLKAKFIKSNPGKEKEADRIINEMIEKLLKYKSLQGLPEIYKTFGEYNEKYKLGLDIQKEAGKVNEIKSKETESRIIKDNQKLKELEKKGASKEDIEKQKKVIKESEKELRKNEVAKKIIQKTSNETISKINSGELKYEDYITNLVSKDKDLQKDFDKLNIGLDGKDLPNVEKVEKLNKDSDSTQSGTKLTYSEVNSSQYKIETNSGAIEVSYRELTIIKNNKEALDNLINFRNILRELNLEGLLKYRENIFQAITNKYTFQFKTGDDYLNESEVMIFLKSILKSIGYSDISNIRDINLLKSEIKAINIVGIITGQRDVNISGNSTIEDKFINKFDPSRLNNFKQNAFEESLDNLFGKTV